MDKKSVVRVKKDFTLITEADKDSKWINNEVANVTFGFKRL